MESNLNRIELYSEDQIKEAFQAGARRGYSQRSMMAGAEGTDAPDFDAWKINLKSSHSLPPLSGKSEEENPKPELIERFTDNGEHSHWELFDPSTDEKLWDQFDIKREKQIQHLKEEVQTFIDKWNPFHQLSEISDEDEWIEVSKELPELTEPLEGTEQDGSKNIIFENYIVKVLAYNEELGIFKAERTKFGWSEISSNSSRGCQPTHWKNLPKIPNKKP